MLRCIAGGHLQEGNFVEAKTTLEEALALSRQIDTAWSVAQTLGDLSNVLSAQGNLDDAKKRLQEVLAIERKMHSGDTSTVREMAGVLTLQGDLAGAKKRLEETLPSDIGPADLESALELLDLANILRLRGDLDGARKRLNTALPVVQAAPFIFSDDRYVFAARSLELSFLLSNAEVSFEEGHPFDAQVLVKQALAKYRASADLFPWLGKWSISETQVETEIRLATILIAMGKVVEAQSEIDNIAEFITESRSRRLLLEYAIVSARILAASGRVTEAKKTLEAADAEATKYRFLGAHFEARFAMCVTEMRSGEFATGRMRLAALEKEARSKGFLLIARKAAIVAGDFSNSRPD